MAWVRSAPSGGWRAEYRSSDGKKHSRTFPKGKKGAATRWLADQVSTMNRGTWVDPSEGMITFVDYVERWLPTKVNLRPSSRARIEGALKSHVLPALGAFPLSSIRRTDVQGLVSSLVAQGKAPATVRKVFNIVTDVMGSAVVDDRIGKSPCIEIALPEISKREMRYLDDAELHHLAAEVPPRYRALILVAGYVGLRWGELAGLRRGSVSLRKLVVSETVVELNGHLEVSRPKTSAGVRELSMPAFVAEVLAEQMARYPEGEHIFTAPEGGPLRRRNFGRRVFEPAIARANLAPLRLHDLRHTAAAIAVDTGAQPVQVQRMLGHASIQMTLGTYGHLFEKREQRLAAKLDARARKAAARFAASLPRETPARVVSLVPMRAGSRA